MTTESSLPAVTAQQLQTTMRELSARARAWWKRDGFGHLSAVHLSEGGGLSLDLSCSLYSEVEERMYDEDPLLPETERRTRVLRHFENRGFVLHVDPGNDVAVRDCDTSCQSLRQLIKNTFPSSVVMSLETRGTRDGSFVLQSAQVLIRDLADVFALPSPPPDA